jgi:hypothetical protein
MRSKSNECPTTVDLIRTGLPRGKKFAFCDCDRGNVRWNGPRTAELNIYPLLSMEDFCQAIFLVLRVRVADRSEQPRIASW